MENSFWVRHYPQKHVKMLRELSFTYLEIHKRSQKLFLKMGALGILGLVVGLILPMSQKWIGLIPMALAFLILFTEKMKVSKVHDSFNDQRHFEFLYFFQLLVPHLKQATSSRLGLFNVLTKMEDRLPTEDEGGGILKQGVNQLLMGITNHPGNIDVFKEFARACSGTDLAEDVCVALFDWQQNTADIKQLDRLKDLVNNALDQRVLEIAEKKVERFEWYSSRVLIVTVIMSIIVLIAGMVLQGMDILKGISF